MGGFNNYVDLSPEIVKKLTWLKDPVSYIHRNSSYEILRGVLYEISEDTYEKAVKRLSGEKGELVSGDKVYVLPNCRIPLYKLKDYFSSMKCTQTSDINECTKIIGHDKIKEQVRFQAGGTVMLIEMPEVLWKDDMHLAADQWFRQDKVDIVLEKYNNMLKTAEDLCDVRPEKTLLSQAAVGNVGHISVYNFKDRHDPKWFITPTGAGIIYNQILRKIPVISENSIFEKIGKPVILDEEVYQSIYDYFNSEDEGNQKMGSEILSNCDIDKSLYWIWTLAREKQHVLNSQSRFKNIRLFKSMSRWNDLAAMSEEDFIEYMFDKGLLTKEYFEKLWPIVARSYTKTLNSSIMTVSMEPSEKYKEFGGQKILFTKEESLDKEIPEDDPEEEEDE